MLVCTWLGKRSSKTGDLSETCEHFLRCKITFSFKMQLSVLNIQHHREMREKKSEFPKARGLKNKGRNAHTNNLTNFYF